MELDLFLWYLLAIVGLALISVIVCRGREVGSSGPRVMSRCPAPGLLQPRPRPRPRQRLRSLRSTAEDDPCSNLAAADDGMSHFPGDWMEALLGWPVAVAVCAGAASGIGGRARSAVDQRSYGVHGRPGVWEGLLMRVRDVHLP